MIAVTEHRLLQTLMIFSYSSYHRPSFIPASPFKIKMLSDTEKITLIIALIEMHLPFFV